MRRAAPASPSTGDLGVRGPCANGALPLLTDDPDAFGREWPAEPLRAHRDPALVRALLDLTAVDELLADHGLRVPSVAVVKDGVTVDPARYTVGRSAAEPRFPDAVDPRAIERHLAGGHTVILQGLDRDWPPVTELCRRLTAEVGHPVRANAYLTPPSARGFDHHWDTHSVFVVQTEGSKTWRLYSPPVPDPLPGQRLEDAALPPEHARRIYEGAPDAELLLRPGDVLWLPRGWVHSARAEAGTSLHVTVGVHQLTGHWALTQLAELARTDERLRRALPPRCDKNMVEVARQMRAQLHRFLDGYDDEQLARHLTAAYQRRLPAPAHRPVARVLSGAREAAEGHGQGGTEGAEA